MFLIRNHTAVGRRFTPAMHVDPGPRVKDVPHRGAAQARCFLPIDVNLNPDTEP